VVAPRNIRNAPGSRRNLAHAERPPYAHRRVVGDLIKRFFNGMVFFLAILMFFLVPIGKKTGAQHAAAIFSTKPAHEAAESVADAARRLTVIVADEITKLRRTADLQSRKQQAPASAQEHASAP
jgi:hypothetical protein